MPDSNAELADRGNPLGGLTYEDYKARNIPATTIVIAQDYQMPVNEQVSLGLAQQVGDRYGLQADFVDDLRLPRPAVYAHPADAEHRPNTPLQTGFNARPVGQGWLNQIQFPGSYTLSKTMDNHMSNRGGTPANPFNLEAEWSDSQQDQRHRFTTNVIVPLPYDMRLSAIYFLGSERVINVAATLDPFRLGHTARWLNDAGDILARNSERTRVNRLSFEGIVDVFNVLNTWNLTNDGTNFYGATYLRPANSTNIFYQPRQVQFGFRITY